MDAGSRETDDDGSARDIRSRRQQMPESGAAEAAGTRHRRSQARPADLDQHRNRGQHPGQGRQSQSRSQIPRELRQRLMLNLLIHRRVARHQQA